MAQPSTWSEWNEGVSDIRVSGPFEAGTTAVMIFPDGTELPFHLAWVDEGRGFEDVTPIPDAGVTVRVVHEVEATETGALITYRCMVEGPPEVAAEVGAEVSADFGEVIAALGARAERLRG
ncbi:hypothetical protein ASD37_08925 [Mycobacterium sp. Root135]|nr:hypothetical protein ASD37_08925 [Mycobacterium sp. Root135]